MAASLAGRALIPAGVIAGAIGYLFIHLDAGPYTYIVSVAFIVLLALPSYAALLRWLPPFRALGILFALSVLAVMVEALAIFTGFPYGEFSYAGDLGYRVFGLVPWTVAFAYLPMLLGSIAVASHIAGTAPARFIATSGLVLVLVDLIVDPALVHAGMWVWPQGGLYYGIPATNFLGWFITGSIYAGIFYAAARQELSAGLPVPIGIAASLLLILGLWTGYLFWAGLSIPAVTGVLLFAAIGGLVLTRGK